MNHVLIIPNLNLITLGSVDDFLSKSVEMGKVVVEFPRLNYRYSIVNHTKRVDPPYSPSMFLNALREQCDGDNHFTFYDTTSSREFSVNVRTNDFLVFRYLNCAELQQQVLIRDICGINGPNQDLQYHFDLDAFGYGDEDGTRYPTSRNNKISGSKVNFNNKVKFVSKNYATTIPDYDVHPEVLFP